MQSYLDEAVGYSQIGGNDSRGPTRMETTAQDRSLFDGQLGQRFGEAR
jgi:hypothetical protein